MVPIHLARGRLFTVEIAGISAVVTGGAGGLGEATVRRLAGAGAYVVIADLADDRGKALAEELGPERAAYAHADVTQEDDVLSALATATARAPLRATVAAHGGPTARARVVGRDATPMPLAAFQRTLNLYLTGTFNLLRLGAAEMSANEPLASNVRGVCVLTASIAAYEGQVGQSDYAAAKAGVAGLTLVAARDLSSIGVRVMTIAPGTFFTPAFRMPQDEAEERWGNAVPFPKRMGQAAEYADLVVSILQNDYLNGETIRIDGAQRFGLKLPGLAARPAAASSCLASPARARAVRMEAG
jgi:NAD(P)-dependent dehydrogenase (short-subunit alcohol dehydrogenase family)